MELQQLIGTTVGDFQIEELIGRGGMASVFRAKQISLQRSVALKVISIQKVSSQDEVFARRFEKEAAFISSLEHIHILPVYAYGIENQYAYLAMRLLPGGSLKDLLEQTSPLPLERAIRIFDQVAQAIAYAHSQGIIHRDIKPGNILLDSDGNAYLMDFGLARLVDSQEKLTRSDSLVGTAAYMAPEQLRGEVLDNRADIYAMGILLYEMVCGCLPFQLAPDSDVIAVLYKHLEGTPAPPTEVNPDIPDQLEAVILRALAKEPGKRFQEVREMAQAVHAVPGLHFGSSDSFPLASTAIRDKHKTSVEKPTLLLSKDDLSRKRQRLMLWGAAALTTVLVVLFVLLMSGVFSPEDDTTDVPEVHFDFALDEDASAEWNQLAPSETQIWRARAALGENGFVAVLACNRSSEYHATMNREISDRLRSYDFAFRIYDADSDAYQQRLMLEEALSEGARAYILCPLDYSLLDEALLAVESAGYPLVSHDNGEHNYGGAITSNRNANYDMGLTVGRFAGEIIQNEMDGEARVVILDFPDLEVIVERANGLEDGVLEIAPDAIIVGRYQGGTQQFAYESVAQLLADGINFDVIVSINDAGSYGAIQALEEAGITPEDVFIASIDAEQRAVNYVEEEYFIRGTLEVGRRATAISSVDIITQMLAGATVPKTIIVPSGNIITTDNLPVETALDR